MQCHKTMCSCSNTLFNRQAGNDQTEIQQKKRSPGGPRVCGRGVWLSYFKANSKTIIAMSTAEQQQLEDRILAKRQQIEFERTNLEETIAFSPENRENPEVMEETKNFDDPAQNVVEGSEMRALKAAERELDELLRQLEAIRAKSGG